MREGLLLLLPVAVAGAAVAVALGSRMRGAVPVIVRRAAVARALPALQVTRVAVARRAGEGALGRSVGALLRLLAARGRGRRGGGGRRSRGCGRRRRSRCGGRGRAVLAGRPAAGAERVAVR